MGSYKIKNFFKIKRAEPITGQPPDGMTLLAQQNLLDVVLLLEFLHPSGRVDDLLLLGVKWVAVGTNFNVKVLRG